MAETSLAMLPWFPRDWLASTRAMRIAERGAYHDLLCFQWEMGALPADHERLARLLGLSAKEFAEVWPAIESKFVVNGLSLFNKRLEEHRVKALEQREKKRRAAQSTNAKRDAKRSGERHADRAHEDTSLRALSGTPPSPSPSPDTKKEDSVLRTAGDESPREFVWRVGVALLTSSGGNPGSARSFLGKLCRDYGDDAVREAVGNAVSAAPAEPRAWLEGALRNGTSQSAIDEIAQRAI